ncbi:MAG: hypothetical protein ABEK04_01975 [Candidatus Nanohalobium sp.]
MQPSNFLEDLGLRIVGAAGAVGLIFLLAYLGDIFRIGFLNSGGGLLIATVVLMEVFFFTALLYGVFTDRI